MKRTFSRIFSNERAFYTTLLKIALPITLQSLLSVSVNMLDNIMVGSLGEAELAGVELANSLTIFIGMFIGGVGGGISLMMSQYFGKRDMDGFRTVYSVAMRMCLCIMVPLTVFTCLFPRAVMSVFTNIPEMIDTGSYFMRIVCISYLFSAFSTTLVSMLRSAHIVNIALFTTIGSLLINLGLNYVLIFGKLGLPAMGIRGAAWATVITRGLELCVYAYYVFVHDHKIGYRVQHLLRYNKDMARDFRRYGLPIIIGDLQWGLVGVVKSTMIGRLGTMMVAANGIANVPVNVGYAFATGLSQAACVIIGKSVGEGDYAKTRIYSNTIQLIFAVVGLCAAGVMLLLRNILPPLYNISAETQQLAVTFIIIAAFSFIGTAYHASCFVGINRGAGDSRFVFKVDMVCGWLVVIPATFITGILLQSPLPVVFFATRCDQFYKWIIAFFRLKGDKWIKNVTREKVAVEK